MESLVRMLPAMVVTTVIVALAVLVVVLLVLWLVARASGRRAVARSVEATRALTDSQHSIAGYAGRVRVSYETLSRTLTDVTAILGQAEAADYGSREDSDVAVRAVAAIADSSRSSIADLRRAIDLVRDRETDPPAPAAQSSRDQLFNGMREAGLAITVTETGAPFELGESARLAVFRILQLALSNALSHGGEGTEVTVGFSWTDDTLRVRVDDDGERAASRRAGLDPNDVATRRRYDADEGLSALTGARGAGVIEMRERAELHGGILQAHAVPGVGFSVSVVFPGLRYNNGIHNVNLDRPAAQNPIAGG